MEKDEIKPDIIEDISAIVEDDYTKDKDPAEQNIFKEDCKVKDLLPLFV